MSLKTFSACQIHTANEEGRNLQKLLALNSSSGLGPRVLHTDSGSFSPSPPHNTKPLLHSQDGFLLPMKPRVLSPLTRVLAAKLDVRVTNVGHPLTALLVAGVHAVSVPVAAPPQGDAQAI